MCEYFSASDASVILYAKNNVWKINMLIQIYIFYYLLDISLIIVILILKKYVRKKLGFFLEISLWINDKY